MDHRYARLDTTPIDTFTYADVIIVTRLPELQEMSRAAALAPTFGTLARLSSAATSSGHGLQFTGSQGADASQGRASHRATQRPHRAGIKKPPGVNRGPGIAADRAGFLFILLRVFPAASPSVTGGRMVRSGRHCFGPF